MVVQSTTILKSVVYILIIILLAIIVYLLCRNSAVMVAEIVVDESAAPHFETTAAAQRLRTSQQVRAALPKRKQRDPWLTPPPVRHTNISRSHFTSVLPGTVDVVPGKYHLRSSLDLRKYLSRGDPVKIGPQVFTIDMETKDGRFQSGLSERHYKQRFTANRVPLGKLQMHEHHSGLIGPPAQGVHLYTTQWVQEGIHEWTGPSGGMIGYWESPHGKWIHGDCPPDVNHGYLPIWFGPHGKQITTLNINTMLGCDGDYCPEPRLFLNVPTPSEHLPLSNEHTPLVHLPLSNEHHHVTPALIRQPSLHIPVHSHESHTAQHYPHTAQHDSHNAQHYPRTAQHNHHTTQHNHHTAQHDPHPAQHYPDTAQHNHYTAQHDPHPAQHDPYYHNSHVTQQPKHPLPNVHQPNPGFTMFTDNNPVTTNTHVYSDLPVTNNEVHMDQEPLSQSIHTTNKLEITTELSDAIWKRMNPYVVK
jgi:hypothetical protein